MSTTSFTDFDDGPDLSTAEGFREYLRWLFEITGTILHASGYLAPVAHLTVRTHPVTRETLQRPGVITVLCPKMTNNREKDAWVDAIRTMCSSLGAIGVVVVNESWMLESYDESVKEISKHPDRVEVVCFMVEHTTFEPEMWCGKITRDGDEVSMDKPTSTFTKLQGRFTRFIPERTMN